MDSIFKAMYSLYSFFHDQIIGSFFNVTNLHFAENYVYLLLFVICFVILIVKRKDLTRGYLLLGIFTSIVLIILFILPTQMLFNMIPASDDSVFARLWLLCPVWLVIAYVAAASIPKMENKVYKTVVSIVLVLVIVFFGNTIQSLNMLNNPQTPYKIRAASVDIANEVLRLNNGKPTSIFLIVPDYADGENYINGGTINMGIQQYTGDIQLTPFKCSDDLWNSYCLSDITPTDREAEEWLGAFVSERYAATGAEFYASPTNEIVDKRLEDLGYECISTVSGYSIYKMKTP